MDASRITEIQRWSLWKSWPGDKFLTNISICWPAPITQKKFRLRALEPKIHTT